MNRAAAPGDAAPAAWPRPEASAIAALEFATPWVAVLLAGVLALVALVLAFRSDQAQALHDARMQVTLHDIAARLEADLALGYELNGSPRAQALLEDALARDPGLLGAEVFDARGVSLFNTDRGSIGEQVPQAWLDAAAKRVSQPLDDPPWAVDFAGERTVGLPVNDVVGQAAAHVSVTTARAEPPRPLVLLGGGLVAAILVAAAAVWLARRTLRAEIEADESEALDAAARRLAASQSRLDEVLRALTQEEGAPR